MPSRPADKTSSPIWENCLVAVGLAAIVVGLLWGKIVPDTSYWSEDDAKAYAEAYDTAHAASSAGSHSHTHSSAGESEGQVDLATARKRVDEWEQRLNRAKSVKGYLGKVIASVGAVVALVGVILLRNAESS